ncbi:MAG: hypothetical protein HC908_10500 [Calothrix sp. SM1_7_51]|nr:hypothetical protein [Calothrix sp. SM1_7_51]
MKIKAYGAQNKGLEAVELALDVLQSLGVEFPRNPTQEDVQLAMAEVSSSLGERKIEELIELPEMTDAQILGVMIILSSAVTFVYLFNPQLFPLVTLKQIDLSIKYGNTHLSSYAYAMYSVMLCGLQEDIESGFQFSQLALNLLEKQNDKKKQSKNTSSN